MLSPLSIDDLFAYTDWDRERWHNWFRANGVGALATSTGPGGDGRISTVGELIRHIFSAELRYAERYTNQPLTDTTSISSTDVETLFEFGRHSRQSLTGFVAGLTEADGGKDFSFSLFTSTVTASPKKVVMHVLVHEIRHWAQIATMLRGAGHKVDHHDLLFSSVLGGGIKRG